MSQHFASVDALPFLMDCPPTTPCPACRVEVVLHPDPYGRPALFRPLGYAHVLDRDSGAMAQRTVFSPHHCEEMAAWRDMLAEERHREEVRRYQERQRLVSEENRLRREANRAEREEEWEQAMQVKCPKCGVSATTRCENLVERKRGVHKPTAWPHAERVIAATSGISRPDVGTQIAREGGLT